MLPNLSYLCHYCLSFCFVLTIVLAVHRFKVSDYKYGIFKHFPSQFIEDAFELYKIYILKSLNHLSRFKNLKIGARCWYCYVSRHLAIFQFYRGGTFYWWRKPEYPVKSYRKSLYTLSHNVASSTPRYERDSNSRTHSVSGDRLSMHRSL